MRELNKNLLLQVKGGDGDGDQGDLLTNNFPRRQPIWEEGSQ
jgi:hypothetical protein